MQSRFVLCLPAEDEIETTVEKRIPETAGLIEKTIRYKDGIRVKFIQDFKGKVLRFSMNACNDHFWICGNRVLGPKK